MLLTSVEVVSLRMTSLPVLEILVITDTVSSLLQ